jgi:hypothetical protein
MITYDMPVYRPPSEGPNLIIQATLGCSFNGCSFCSMYKAKSFRIRPLDDVFADIKAGAEAWPDAHRVFLADGDALVLPTDHLLRILDSLHQHLPDLARVAAYATPVNLRRKSLAELVELKRRGLNLIYVGIESGSADILKRIRKGATRKSLIAALTKAIEAELKVSATVVLGLGGRNRWRDHADGTADLISQAPPTYLSTLQLYLEDHVVERFTSAYGEPFDWQSDEGILDEQERLIAGIQTTRPIIFRSNHASNCLALAGNLPRDKDRLLAQIAQARQGAVALRPLFARGL